LFSRPCSSSRPQRAAADPPPQLPLYDLDITLDAATHRATIRERVTWTNNTRTATSELAFSFYPHYKVPAGEALLFAKTLELLRLQPSLGIERDGRMGDVQAARLLQPNGPPLPLKWSYEEKNSTALRFELPARCNPDRRSRSSWCARSGLPNKQGRWGYYEGVTFLTNAIPLLAVCDDTGWKPMPFVPWHSRGTTKRVCSARRSPCPKTKRSRARRSSRAKQIRERHETPRIRIVRRARLRGAVVNAFTANSPATTKLPDGRTVALKVLAFPEHEFYATEILKIVGEAIPVYSRWFGAYPYAQFTVAESYFGWERQRVRRPHHGR